MTSILTVTLNPALDITTAVDRVGSGTKLRCETPRFDPGGGGINVSRAIKKLGGDSRAVAAIGGAVGKTFRSLLEDEGITAHWIGIDGATRESFVVHEHSTGLQYRFVLPGPEWHEETGLRALEEILRLIGPGDYVVASGSLPPGLPDTFYSDLATQVSQAGARPLFDTSGRPLKLLSQQAAHPSAVHVMDEIEACQLVGCTTLEIEDARSLACKMVTSGAVGVAVITLGARGALAISHDQGWQVAPPLVKVDSKVGAGDSFMAALTLGLSASWSLREALIYAMAAATSAVMTPATELCTKASTDALRGAVTSASI
ncbi:MAG: 1-phosphofructokinase family hexose kinase [Pseudomonadales bacterium]